MNFERIANDRYTTIAERKAFLAGVAEGRKTGMEEAARGVIERWDTPLWKDVPATAIYINKLRAALEEK